MFNKFSNVQMCDIGIDLGTANSVVYKENGSIDLSETDGETGTVKRHRPEQDDNSFKLRFLNDEKVRLTAALGKCKHREILLMAKGRKNMYHGTSRHHEHRKLVRKKR